MVKQAAITALLVAVVAIATSPPSRAEARFVAGTSAAPPPRDLVVAAVDTARMERLPNNRMAWAVQTGASGTVPDDTPLQNLSIELHRSAEREAAFQQLLRDQQNPASGKFHRWLTPIEIGEQFGVSPHDIEAVSAWLTARGMSGVRIANSRTRIFFNATAGTAAKAFNTQLAYFSVGAEQRIGNADDPQIPSAFAPIIRSIRGLSSERYYPQRISRSALLHRGVGADQPNFTNCSGGVCSHVIFPADFATIYNIQSTISQGITGSGQHIAIVGRARVNSADLQNFSRLTGVTVADPNVIVPPNGIDPGPAATTCTTTGTNTCSNPSPQVDDQGEATLDVTRAASVAPGATIDLIVSADGNNSSGVAIAEIYAIDTNPPPAKVLNISFGICEGQVNSSFAQSDDALFQQGAAEGISILVSSGDQGAAECNPHDKPPPASQSLSINAHCASGSVTCVGGTEFADQSNSSAYWSTTNSAGNESALGYIPEGAWNDPLGSNGQTQSNATGGGISRFIPTPSWQTGAGVPGTQGRYAPDVSFPASASEGYFDCVAAAGASCVTNNGSASFELEGGTSASAPSMAGIVALLNQKTGSAQGNLNPRLYALAASPSNGVFHDVTVASSGVSGCSLATPSMCNNSTPGPTGLSGGLPGYLVGNGYDLATGLGSINVGNLLANWAAATTSGPVFGQGNVSYSFNAANNTVQLHADTISNPSSATTGSLRLELWGFTTPFTGTQSGFTIATSASLGTLSAGQSLTNVSVTIPFTSLANGGYDLTMFLEEQSSSCASSSGFCFDDFVNFSSPLTFPLSSSSSIKLGGYLSGNWFDPSPNQSGHGFQFEFTGQANSVIAIWFVYPPNGGGQNWIYAQGTFDPNMSAVTVPAALLTGPKFPPFYNNNDLQQTSWGTITFTFTDCNNGTASWNSTLPGYGSGTIPIRRLTSIQGTTCPQ